MCMLTFLPPNVLPNTDRLRNGTISNRDGHGWAIVVLDADGRGSHILTGHSMNADAAIEAFKLTRGQHPQGPALFHSRYTTGGLVDEGNCHPYVVNGDPRTILAHNGVLPYSINQPDKDERSDTRYFADVYGMMFYPDAIPGESKGQNFNLNSKRGRKRAQKWLGLANKFVILTVDPIFRRNSYILNSDQGVWEDDDCWYSNSGYQEKTYGTSNRWSYGYMFDEKDWYADAKPRAKGSGDVWTRLASAVGDERYITDKHVYEANPVDPGLTCEICGAKNQIVANLNYCAVCFTCQDCMGDTYDQYSDRPCECFWPLGTHPGRQAMVSKAFSVGTSGEAARDYGDGTEASPCPKCRFMSCPGSDTVDPNDCTSVQEADGLYTPGWLIESRSRRAVERERAEK